MAEGRQANSVQQRVGKGHPLYDFAKRCVSEGLLKVSGKNIAGEVDIRMWASPVAVYPHPGLAGPGGGSIDPTQFAWAAQEIVFVSPEHFFGYFVRRACWSRCLSDSHVQYQGWHDQLLHSGDMTGGH